MIDSYNSEPHFREENQNKVKKRLQELQKKTNAKNLLDIGCGTGFILNLAKDMFQELHGVDITPAMLEKVDLSSGNITLHNALAQEMPFEDSSFDMASAYAFIHHLEDYKKVLHEAYRVLKKGAIFYIDLEPNRLFWESMNKLEKADETSHYNPIVNREINSVLHTDRAVEEEFGIKADIFNSAEYTKSILGGIDAKEFCKDALEIGFSVATYEYDWFLGQGSIMHENSFEEAIAIENYLKSITPLADHTFKYVRIILQK
jgi:ubiquinone/menaquinone biosynthesis C-methylase UbiE